MYIFDKEDIVSMKKRLNKDEIGFNDYIPNSMNPRRLGSKADLS